MVMAKKMEENGFTPYLTEELLVNIFLKLPVNVHHESVRLVCKCWASVTRNRLFIEAHLQKSKSNLFIYDEESAVPAHFLEFNGLDFAVRDVRHWFPGPMLTSCDGVALFTNSIHCGLFWVRNPITMQMTPLPYLEETIGWLRNNTHVSHIPSTGECKVVDVYEDEDATFHWFVLTVGVNKTWRKLYHEHNFVHFHANMDGAVFSIGGVLYWPYLDFEMDGAKCSLGMDMAEESIYYVAVPRGCIKPHEYLQMGDYLSGFSDISDNLSRFEVRFLKNWKRGEWCKMCDIDMGISKVTRDALLWPAAWLNNVEVVLFVIMTSRGSHVAYNVKKKGIEILDLSRCGENLTSVVHTNSLVSW